MVVTLMFANTAASYLPVLLLILAAAVLAATMLLVSQRLGSSRSGPVKGSAYESGMPVIGDARRRFNVKFYIVAMLFLLFDVEIVFLWPWAPLFVRSATRPDSGLAVALASQGYGAGFLLAEAALFLAILLIGYLYAWRKGVFRWT